MSDLLDTAPTPLRRPAGDARRRRCARMRISAGPDCASAHSVGRLRPLPPDAPEVLAR